MARVLLIQPPYGDYTHPYHAVSYVAGVLEAGGYHVDVLDLNAIWFRHVFRSETVSSWRAELEQQRLELEALPSLSIDQQVRFVEMVECAALCDHLDPELAVGVMRSEAFYDYERYREAREQVRCFELLLDRMYPPFGFSTAFSIPPHESNAERLVARARASRRYIEDAAELLREHTPHDDYLLCGVSLSFSSHLCLGLATLIAIAEVFPSAITVAGGTAISDIWRYRRSDDILGPFSELCRYFYTGEAETGLVALADHCRDARAPLPPQAIDLRDPAEVDRRPIYVSLSRRSSSQRSFVAHDWDRHPPNYDWIDWSLYLAPSKCVNYAPSRGCFWNKCTFCDYGLNDQAPTAPARHMSATTVVDHIASLAREGIDHVYFAADALPPRLVEAIADELNARDLDIHWSCQFFLTPQLDEHLLSKLARSGLRCASFGLESGSSAVLERMGKGARRRQRVLEPVLRAIRAEGTIGLQPLFFWGFPGETDHDRDQTVELLLEVSDVMCSIGRGGLFDLLPGSILAKQPESFGIHEIERVTNDDIAGALTYRLLDGSGAPSCTSFGVFNDRLPHIDVHERPWAGGIDTLHTQLYVERHGRNVFQERARPPGGAHDVWVTTSVTSRYDLDEIMQNVIIRRGLDSHASRGSSLQIDMDHEEIESLIARVEPGRASERYDLRLRPLTEITCWPTRDSLPRPRAEAAPTTSEEWP